MDANFVHVVFEMEQVNPERLAWEFSPCEGSETNDIIQ